MRNAAAGGRTKPERKNGDCILDECTCPTVCNDFSACEARTFRRATSVVGLPDLVSAINEAIGNGDGHLYPMTLAVELKRRGLLLSDDRDIAGTPPNTEALIEAVIDAWNAAMMARFGEFNEHRFAYELERADVFLVYHTAYLAPELVALLKSDGVSS